MKGKSGPKVRASDVRDALYQWVVDIRSALKGRLPKAMMIAKAEQLQQKWITENPNLAVDCKPIRTVLFIQRLF